MNLSPLPIQKFFDDAGRPLNKGRLFVYTAGTTTKTPTYTDSTGGTPNTNPVQFNARGEAQVWIDATLAYKFVLAPPGTDDPPTSIIWTVDQIESGLTYTDLVALLTQQFIGGILYPRTAAEIAASVTPTNYYYPPLDIRRYGADPTGSATSDSARDSAIAVCGTTGGTIICRADPGSTFKFSTPFALNTKTSIIFDGGSGMTSGAAPATTFSYSGTTSPWINMDSATGCGFRGVRLVHTNAGFTGTYIRCNNDGTHGDPADNYLADVTFGGGPTTTVHLDLNKCTNFTAERCLFGSGNPSVKGMHAGGYSNVIRFRDCVWPDASNAVVPIQGLGQAWTFEGCEFGSLTTGAPGAIVTTSSTVANGLTIRGCWFGDATTTAGTWIDIYGQSFEFSGNYISGNATGSTAIKLNQFHGAVIKANTFDTFLNGINFATATSAQIEVKDNVALSVTNPWVNTANVSAGSLDWGNNYGFGTPSGHAVLGTAGYMWNPRGLLEQWGTKSVTTGTPVSVTYSVTFPNNCFNVVVTVVDPSGTNNTAYAQTVGTSGFTTNVNGTAGSNTVHWRAIGN